MKIGDKVVMSETELKRNFSNWMYEMYFHPVKDGGYDEMIQLTLLACMAPLESTITSYGATLPNNPLKRYLGVRFKIGDLEHFAYFYPRSLKLV